MKNELSKLILLTPAETKPRLIQVDGGDVNLMQKLVGGNFDIISPSDYGITGAIAKYDIFVNDDMLSGMPPNVALNKKALLTKNYNLACLIFGPLVVAGYDDEGRTVGVAEEDIQEIIKVLCTHLLANSERGE